MKLGLFREANACQFIPYRSPVGVEESMPQRPYAFPATGPLRRPSPPDLIHRNRCVRDDFH